MMMGDELECLLGDYQLGYKHGQEQTKTLTDKNAALKKALRDLITVTKHLKPCPGTVAMCEELLK